MNMIKDYKNTLEKSNAKLSGKEKYQAELIYNLNNIIIDTN